MNHVQITPLITNPPPPFILFVCSTLIAEKLAIDTTSEGAAGLWKPFALGSTPPEKVNAWGGDTFKHYLEIFNSPDASKAGIFMCPAYELYHTPVPDPVWSTVVPSYRHLSAADLAMYDHSNTYSYGFAYDTIIAEGRLYMQWLLERLQTTHFEIQQRKVQSFKELTSFDAVINCAGLGSRELADDPSLQGIRGHVVRVKAPWIRYHVEADQLDDPLHRGPAYIIPNADSVVLGGTKVVGDEDCTPRKEDTEAILARCTAAVPSLAGAEVLSEWVGLRPGRPSVRLEVEYAESSSSSVLASFPMGKQVIVHNYGHGGSGLTLGWGCAGEAVELLESTGVV